jgi:phospholipase D/transphosphatidylase|nr:cardiolipin synthase [uncultured Capnocytophaga sp.]
MKLILLYEILYILFVIAVCLRIIWDTRSVSKALAYLLLVIFVPIAGAIFYFSFGINYRRHKIYHKKLTVDQAFRRQLEQIYPRIQAHLESLGNSVTASYEKSLRFLSNIEERLLLIPNEEVKVICNGENLFPELLESLRSAQHHIHIEYYIYENDHIGNAIKDILIEKAREGVEIRFIYDDFGSQGIRRNIARELRENGVPAFPFYKINFVKLANRMNYRNHRKIVVVDGYTAFIGGINISDKYNNTEANERYWRDTHLKVKGYSAHVLQAVFLQDWNFCSGENVAINAPYFPIGIEPHPTDYFTQIVASGADSDLPNILYATVQLIYAAKREILITTPYYIPDTSLQESLIIAALSGIKVKLLVPQKGDSVFVHIACESFFEELLKAGVEIYLYEKGFVHAKTFVIDGEVASVGTANLDARSFDLNFEVNALVYNKTVASDLQRIFYNDLKNARLLQLEQWQKRSEFKQMIERVVRLFSPFL